MNWLRNQWAQLLAIYRSDDFSRYLRDTAVAFSVIMIPLRYNLHELMNKVS